MTYRNENAPGLDGAEGVEDEQPGGQDVAFIVDDHPVIPARFVPPNTLVVTCPHCELPHYHGAGDPPPGESPAPAMYGPRAAHCRNLLGRGYVLAPAAEVIA